MNATVTKQATNWRADAVAALLDEQKLFVEVAALSPDVDIEMYKPSGVDRQTPHDRDELYFVISGSGVFEVDDRRIDFSAGDGLFVPAHAPHRFVEFSDDFLTWVVFYGPKRDPVP